MNASDTARALGRKGGRVRARRLSAADKKRIASMGGRARSQSLLAARRIAENFRYVGVLGALRPRRAAVKRLNRFRGPLPGLYPAEP